MIARKHQHILRVHRRDEVQVLIDCIRCPLIPVSAFVPRVRRQDEYAAIALIEIPCTACAKIIMELERAILREHADLVDTRICTIAQRKVDDTIFAAERYCRLCNILCQSP